MLTQKRFRPIWIQFCENKYKLINLLMDWLQVRYDRKCSLFLMSIEKYTTKKKKKKFNFL